MTAGSACTRKTQEFAGDDGIFFAEAIPDAVSMVFLTVFVNQFLNSELPFHGWFLSFYQSVSK